MSGPWQQQQQVATAAAASAGTTEQQQAAAGKHTTRRCTNLGGQVAPEVLAHRRLDLEDGLVRRRPEVYPAVVQPGVGGHGRRLSPANQTHSKHARHDEDCRLRGDRGTMRGARGRARKGEGVDANSRGARGGGIDHLQKRVGPRYCRIDTLSQLWSNQSSFEINPQGGTMRHVDVVRRTAANMHIISRGCRSQVGRCGVFFSLLSPRHNQGATLLLAEYSPMAISRRDTPRAEK